MSQYVNITARRIAEPVQGENCVLKGCGLFSQILEAGKSRAEVLTPDIFFLTQGCSAVPSQLKTL